jgi:hypothetical protein
MSNVLLSPPCKQGDTVAYNFYREGMGFGQIEAIEVGENGGIRALTTFFDSLSPEDPAFMPVQHEDYVSVIEEGEFDSKPITKLETEEDALRIICGSINAVVSERRYQAKKQLEAEYSGRLHKPRVKRAFEKRLLTMLSSDAQYERCDNQ